MGEVQSARHAPRSQRRHQSPACPCRQGCARSRRWPKLAHGIDDQHLGLHGGRPFNSSTNDGWPRQAFTLCRWRTWMSVDSTSWARLRVSRNDGSRSSVSQTNLSSTSWSIKEGATGDHGPDHLAQEGGLPGRRTGQYARRPDRGVVADIAGRSRREGPRLWLPPTARYDASSPPWTSRSDRAAPQG
jgi:hypothetical protein